MRKLAIIAAVALATLGPAAADTLVYKSSGIELEMKKGAFSSDDRRAQQLLTIKNHSTVQIRMGTVECGFFHGDLLIGRGMALISDLQPGQDAYADIRAYVLSADRSDCRFADVRQ